jgi:hypothetical protein
MSTPVMVDEIAKSAWFTCRAQPPFWIRGVERGLPPAPTVIPVRSSEVFLSLDIDGPLRQVVSPPSKLSGKV